MQRSRLKNIINKSKEKIREPFDDFKSSLPEGIVPEGYRLKEAWKAYGSPRDYKAALWEGMIQPIDENTFKLPSIGYNEETEEYEYLNQGKDNEVVAKDIRVWDNDVIPLVKELKQGGYIRIFNEEKNCWTYSKAIQKETPMDQESGSQEQTSEGVEFLKDGGKPKQRRSDTVLMLYANNSGVPFMKRILTEDTRSIQIPGEQYPATHLLSYGEHNGKTYVFPQVMDDPKGNLWYYGDKAFDRAMETNDYLEMSPEEAEWFTTHYKNYYPNFFNKFKEGGILEFKQGGAVIPSGSLHAHKNHMKLASEGLITPKGIPVISEENGEIQQQAEIEREEVIFDKQATTDIEKLYKKFNETDKESEKNEIAIKAGKILTDIFINNTEDNTGLIEKVAEKNNLEYNK